MADNFCILRAEKISKIGSVISSLAHELRTREAENADPEKLKKNIYSVDEGKCLTADAIPSLTNRQKVQNMAIKKYKKLLPEKMKEDNVTCIQLLVTYSPKAKVNPSKYFADAEKWIREKFGSENVFFRADHFDETTPHANFFVVPGYDFKYKDGHTERRLSAKKWLGGRKKLTELQDDFYEKVGKPHNLERGVKGSKAKHQDIKKWYKKFNDFCSELHIDPQKETESVDDYFTRVAKHWNQFTDGYKSFRASMEVYAKEHEFYNKYHDNLDALKEYVATLEKRSQKREKARRSVFSGRSD